VELARAGLAGGLADQVAFAGTALAEAQALDVAADLHDLAREFVAGDERDGHGARAQSSHCQIWMSVPQMPVFLTRIRTSSGPISGTGRVSILEARFRGRPSPGRASRWSWQDSGLAARGLEGVERAVEVGAGEGGVHLGADAGAAMGTTGRRSPAT
jgi:hypothetical protein